MTVDTVAGRPVWQKNGIVGGFPALVTMWPSEAFAVVVLTNSRAEITGRVTADVARIAGNVEAAPDVVYRGERDATPAERAALAGDYTVGQNRLSIRDVDGGLEFRTLDGRVRPARLTRDGSRLVVGAPQDAVQLPYVIVRDPDGTVQFLYRNARAYARVRQR